MYTDTEEHLRDGKLGGAPALLCTMRFLRCATCTAVSSQCGLHSSWRASPRQGENAPSLVSLGERESARSDGSYSGRVRGGQRSSRARGESETRSVSEHNRIGRRRRRLLPGFPDKDYACTGSRAHGARLVSISHEPAVPHDNKAKYSGAML